MTQNELMMMHTLCGELMEARDALEVARAEHNDAKALHDEIKRLEGKERELAERNAMATAANEDLKARCTGLMAERDDARRKLGALLLCVGFHKCYDMTHPRRGMLELQAAVKKCIDENHIVMTEGGMAK